MAKRGSDAISAQELVSALKVEVNAALDRVADRLGEGGSGGASGDTGRRPATSKIDEAVQLFKDAAFQGRLWSAIRAATSEQLRNEGIDLSPAEWGELTARLATSSRDPAETFAAGAVLVAVVAVASDERVKT